MIIDNVDKVVSLCESINCFLTNESLAESLVVKKSELLYSLSIAYSTSVLQLTLFYSFFVMLTNIVFILRYIVRTNKCNIWLLLPIMCPGQDLLFIRHLSGINTHCIQVGASIKVVIVFAMLARDLS